MCLEEILGKSPYLDRVQVWKIKKGLLYCHYVSLRRIKSWLFVSAEEG